MLKPLIFTLRSQLVWCRRWDGSRETCCALHSLAGGRVGLEGDRAVGGDSKVGWK